MCKEEIYNSLEPYIKEQKKVRIIQGSQKTGLGMPLEHSYSGIVGINRHGNIYVVRNATTVDNIDINDIVKIVDSKLNTVYQVDGFHMALSIDKNDYNNKWVVYQHNDVVGTFNDKEKAELYKDYLEGKRNRSW